MLCSIFTPIHTTLNCHWTYLAIFLMVRFCNAVRCWSASHVEHGVKDQVASAVNIFHRGAQLHKYTLLLTVLLSSVLVHGIICLIWILENIKNDANQITQRRYTDFWNPPNTILNVLCSLACQSCQCLHLAIIPISWNQSRMRRFSKMQKSAHVKSISTWNDQKTFLGKWTFVERNLLCQFPLTWKSRVSNDYNSHKCIKAVCTLRNCNPGMKRSLFYKPARSPSKCFCTEGKSLADEKVFIHV